jgi:hypothetical protein
MDYLWSIYGFDPDYARPKITMALYALHLGDAKNEQNTNLGQKILSYTNSYITFDADPFFLRLNWGKSSYRTYFSHNSCFIC